MILITLIENAFKHGAMPVAGRSWIKLNVTSDDEKIRIFVANSRVKGKTGHGIGLENLRNQLDLLYPACYTIQEHAGENDFSVELVLNHKP